MGRTHTHTFVVLGLSRAAWLEVAAKLRQAGYQHAFVEEELIDMQGIAVAPEGKEATDARG